MIQISDATKDAKAIIKKLMARSEETNQAALNAVREIIAAVKARGDAALIEYTRKFDYAQSSIETLRVTKAEIDEAYKHVDAELLSSLRACASSIEAFHIKQKRDGFMARSAGRKVGQLVRPLKRVGVYVPGGRAAYPSSVLMNIIPAKVAGVKDIVMVSPTDSSGKLPPLTLVAANEAGATEIYRAGGAQAVAALAYGTQTIPRVDKIVGPGNIYVALAKREVFGAVGIDMVAGPSEILVIADSRANPAFAAADMLSQAEHDPLAAAFLVTDSFKLAEEVRTELYAQLENLDRKDIASRSLEEQSGIIIASDLNQAAELANAIAPEHLELMVENPEALLEIIENAGSVFLGDYSPESLGDYYAGPNHVLPTGSTSRFASPLSVDDFIKKLGVIHYSRDALEEVHMHIERFALAEGLGAHANSVAIRFKESEGE